MFYNNTPLCLLDLFTKSVTVHSHLTRNVTVNFHVNYSRTGIRLWNELDVNDRLIMSFNPYKKKVLLSLHKYLFSLRFILFLFCDLLFCLVCMI